jgi:hypothetical protein
MLRRSTDQIEGASAIEPGRARLDGAPVSLSATILSDRSIRGDDVLIPACRQDTLPSSHPPAA